MTPPFDDGLIEPHLSRECTLSSLGSAHQVLNLANPKAVAVPLEGTACAEVEVPLVAEAELPLVAKVEVPASVVQPMGDGAVLVASTFDTSPSVGTGADATDADDLSCAYWDEDMQTWVGSGLEKFSPFDGAQSMRSPLTPVLFDARAPKTEAPLAVPDLDRTNMPLLTIADLTRSPTEGIADLTPSREAHPGIEDLTRSPAESDEQATRSPAEGSRDAQRKATSMSRISHIPLPTLLLHGRGRREDRKEMKREEAQTKMRPATGPALTIADLEIMAFDSEETAVMEPEATIVFENTEAVPLRPRRSSGKKTSRHHLVRPCEDDKKTLFDLDLQAMTQAVQERLAAAWAGASMLLQQGPATEVLAKKAALDAVGSHGEVYQRAQAARDSFQASAAELRIAQLQAESSGATERAAELGRLADAHEARVTSYQVALDALREPAAAPELSASEWDAVHLAELGRGCRQTKEAAARGLSRVAGVSTVRQEKIAC
jgi:hypothetical protein